MGLSLSTVNTIPHPENNARDFFTFFHFVCKSLSCRHLHGAAPAQRKLLGLKGLELEPIPHLLNLLSGHTVSVAEVTIDDDFLHLVTVKFGSVKILLKLPTLDVGVRLHNDFNAPLESHSCNQKAHFVAVSKLFRIESVSTSIVNHVMVRLERASDRLASGFP